MKFRTLSAFINTTNSYSILKWPLTIFSCLIIIVSLLLFLSFQSPAWFTFESGRIYKNSTIDITDYGAFGLWERCSGERLQECDTLTRRTRNKNFDIAVILTSCALFLVNLSIFPSLAATILVFYNANNCYIRYIVTTLWIAFSLVLSFTCLLISMLVIVGVTEYYSPGKTISKQHYIVYHTGPGFSCAFVACLFSVIELIIIICSLITNKFIEMQLQDEEKELYRLINDDESNRIWQQAIRVPRDTAISDEDFSQGPPPPPYNQYTDND